MIKITMDFETSSQADLNKVGSYRYTTNESTDLMCLGWVAYQSFDSMYYDENFDQWVDDIVVNQFDFMELDYGDTDPFFELVRKAAQLEAHNAAFEINVWNNICVPRYDFPEVSFESWRCSAAKAAFHGLPRSLDKACLALNLDIAKDLEGKRAMLRLSKNTNVRPGDHQAMLYYNIQDVLAEVALSNALPNLPDTELKIWRLTEQMNLCGIPIDVDNLPKALDFIADALRALTQEFNEITGIERPTMRAQFIEWLAHKEIYITNTQAETMNALLPSLSGDAKRAVEILGEAGKSSVAKYPAINNMVSDDGRVRGSIRYYGAHTGRWSGWGIQPQNFPRTSIVKNQETAWAAIAEGNMDLLADPLIGMSGALRGIFKAPDGYVLFRGDLAQIEARMTAWLAKDEPMLNSFRDPEQDAYLDAASQLYGRRVLESEEQKRFVGKQAVLALGFGAGYIRFYEHCHKFGVTFTKVMCVELMGKEEYQSLRNWIFDKTRASGATLDGYIFSLAVVNRFRKAHKATIVKLWNSVEEAAIKAIRRSGRPFEPWSGANAPLVFLHQDGHLWCKLPSGRRLIYRNAEYLSAGIRYRDTLNHGTSTYGGKLVENIVQALARDIMADGLINLGNTPEFSKIILTVHDEAVSEVQDFYDTTIDLERFVDCLELKGQIHRRHWAYRLPLKAEAKRGRRYGK